MDYPGSQTCSLSVHADGADWITDIASHTRQCHQIHCYLQPHLSRPPLMTTVCSAIATLIVTIRIVGIRIIIIIITVRTDILVTFRPVKMSAGDTLEVSIILLVTSRHVRTILLVISHARTILLVISRLQPFHITLYPPQHLHHLRHLRRFAAMPSSWTSRPPPCRRQ